MMFGSKRKPNKPQRWRTVTAVCVTLQNIQQLTNFVFLSSNCMYLQDIWGFKLFFLRSPTQFFFCILSSVCAETVQNSISSSSLSMSKLPEESEIYKSRLDVFECYHT